MEITEKYLKIKIKEANIWLAEEGARYADNCAIGKDTKKQLRELGLVAAYVESMRYINLLSAELDVDIIAWQSKTTVRYTFNSSPDMTDFSVADQLKVELSGKASNNGTFTISAVNGFSSLLTSLDVDTITFLTQYKYRIAFNGSPDLSGVSVGDRLIETLSTNATNDGDFRITAIDDGADTVDITNLGRIDDEDDETSSPAVADIKTPIDFIEVGNIARTDATDDEASDSPATAKVVFGNRPFTDLEINNILNHIAEIISGSRKGYIQD